MILYNILFLLIWIIIGTILVYTRAYLKYEDKKRIDECYNERSQLKEENEQLKATIKKMKEEIYRDMTLMGCKSVSELNRSKVVFRK